MSLPNEVTSLLAGGAKKYEISRSLRFNSADSAYMNRTVSASDTKKWTWSGWIKRGKLTNYAIFSAGVFSTSSDITGIQFRTDNTIQILQNNGASTVLNKISTAVFRDPSAWYHFVVVFETTNATAEDRVRLYVNGTRITAFSTNTIFAQNSSTYVNDNAYAHRIGRSWTADYFDGYMAEVHFIDGQALTPSSFGETDPVTGVWIPKRYTGTYGTNGFYLSFANNASTTTLGYDDGTGIAGSGAGSNDWTLNNFSVTAGDGNDSLEDTPTNNYCTLNSLDFNGTLSNGNLRLVTVSGNAATTGSTFFVSSGKWYWEVTIVSGVHNGIGILKAGDSKSTLIGTTAGGYSYYSEGASYTKSINNNVRVDYGSSFVAGDTISVALDMDTGEIVFYKNGISQGTAFTGITGLFEPAVSDGSNSTSSTFDINFGQRPFAYTSPAGFKALNTKNLTTPTILKPSQYMNIVTWTGTGATRSITGVGFQPDLVWSKSRSNAETHKLVDSTRGATKALSSATTGDEVTESGITSFDSDGFTIDGATDTGYNTNTYTYVGWNWKKGVTPGFDIVTYTGNGTNRTISHSLGAVPHFMIVKARTTASSDQNWTVYHRNLTSASYYLYLSSTQAEVSLSGVWNATAPTSSVFSVGTSASTNQNNDPYLAYLWTEIAGFSRIGSYTGNSSADGPFVWCGFRPKFIIIKYAGGATDWTMFDSVRNTSNVIGNRIDANANAAESSSTYLDFLSNGFKLRVSGTNINYSGGNHIFAAFAENPFKYSLAR